MEPARVWDPGGHEPVRLSPVNAAEKGQDGSSSNAFYAIFGEPVDSHPEQFSGNGSRVCGDCSYRDSYRECYTATLLSILRDRVPRVVNKSAVRRPVRVSSKLGESRVVDDCTYDSGASNGSYIGLTALRQLSNYDELEFQPCRHVAKLGDGKTIVSCSKTVVLTVSPINDYGEDCDGVDVEFFVMDSMGDEIIIGLQELLGSFFEYFVELLAKAARKPLQRRLGVEKVMSSLDGLCSELEDELGRKEPRVSRMAKLICKARREMVKYNGVKQKVMNHPDRVYRVISEEDGKDSVALWSIEDADALEDDSAMFALVEDLESKPLEFKSCRYAELLKPWSVKDEPCPEEEETPDPLAYGEDVLKFMETSIEDSKSEYYAEFEKHVSESMQKECPKIMEILKRPEVADRFAPSEWNGMKVPEFKLELKSELPDRISPKSRPIRSDLYQHAKVEYERLQKYFFLESTSSVASPLVIAPKSTHPFIRFCGDYRVVNQYIKIPQEPIPIPHLELTKAAKYRVFIDLDMANSFHQIPISEELSNVLSVKTPWGLVRPRFLPEGVGPASGVLQRIVSDIFEDFEEWIIVIFDNFLILGDDYEDLLRKFEKVISKCQEYGIVLKMKKSWFGVSKVTFFGYEVENGTWRLSDERKKAIDGLEFPKTKKQMQSFLGAALFFHHHVPNYSEWSAVLYSMTHDDFIWDPNKWKIDYQAHFERFKECMRTATELHFPDYSKPWKLRCDANEYSVAGVLYMEVESEDGTIVHHPIAFCSKRLSGAATNWDTYKREAFGIYYSVMSFAYYLRGKEFVVETDHRNLQWIETSQSPIIVRWRSLLQSYSFLVRHIPGKENTVADWMTRMYRLRECRLCSVRSADEGVTFEQIMNDVHGNERLHFGAYETWRKAKEAYPGYVVPIEAVRRYVKECGMCNKMRNTGVKGLNEMTLSLKPETYRRRIGIDHVAITPPDKHGYKCAIVVVEHFSHFAQVYPAKDYSEETVCGVLIRHYATFGLFDEIVSDPGSSFLGAVVAKLNRIFGVSHRVSLVGRHESNGVEATNRELLRHLTTLVLEKGVKDRWSEDTVLPLINFALNDRPTAETGRFTPFQLKYGTQDAERFKLPVNIDPEDRSARIVKQLDEDLQVIRAASLSFQREIAKERASGDGVAQVYDQGDLILWNPREHPGDMRPEKLSPNWFGPYRVLGQERNDIVCEHVVMRTMWKFHTARCKPYFGSLEEATEHARYDYNQFMVRSVVSFVGNPHKRSTMQFVVKFDVNGSDDVESVLVPLSEDIANTEQFELFVQSRQFLFPLRYTVREAEKKIAAMNKLSLVDVNIGDVFWVDLRFFDGVGSSAVMWFDSLMLPESDKIYVVQMRATEWKNKQHTAVWLFSELFQASYVFKAYDLFACTVVLKAFDPAKHLAVDKSFRKICPEMFV